MAIAAAVEPRLFEPSPNARDKRAGEDDQLIGQQQADRPQGVAFDEVDDRLPFEYRRQYRAAQRPRQPLPQSPRALSFYPAFPN